MKTENDISYLIRGCIYRVHNELGPGLLESVYARALKFELEREQVVVAREVPVPVFYKTESMDLGFRLDLLVERKVIIEIKSVETLADVHHKQLLTYLKMTKLKLGILVNFNVVKIEEGIHRKVNGL